MDNICNEKEALCFLQMLPGFKKKHISELMKHFMTYSEAANADIEVYESMLAKELASVLVSERELKGIASSIACLKERGIEYCVAGDEDYPRRLLNISDMPISLFCMGKLPKDDAPAVAVIGARNCSGYGRQMAREYAREIAASGIQVISGMAAGVDGIAQRAALSVGGSSYAVLGSGVDVCYPEVNRDLYDELKEKGGIISEYTPGTQPKAGQFPSRNRIISGLSDAVIVIEARERSGTLITVGMALDQSRDVYALPGRITDSLSCGCNRLIWEGATPLLKPYEFVEEFYKRYEKDGGRRPDKSAKKDKKNGEQDNVRLKFLSRNERKILAVLDNVPKTVSEIIYDLGDECELNIPELMQLLTGMTIKHLIDCVDGSNYQTRSSFSLSDIS